jgi:hypothetical protein
VTVDKGTLSLTTYIHDSLHHVVTSVPVGSTVHDTAHFGSAVSGFTPTAANVSFTFFTNSTCAGNGTPENNIGADQPGPPPVNLDPRSQDVAALSSGAYSFIATFSGDNNYNPITADKVTCEPLSVRTFGKTMGYWHNTNGQAKIPSTFTYTLGSNTTNTCYLPVTKANTLTILPGSGGSGLNGVSILQHCASFDTGIQTGSMNTLLSQALALELNIQFIVGFNGQTIGALGLTASLPTAFPPGQSLTASSTVQQVLDYANYLIANAKLNAPGGNNVTITQTEIGALNTFLGLVNSESA